MSADIRSMLLKKQEGKKSKLVMKDVNRALIISLLALPVYGKEARDEEILSVIINAGAPVDLTDRMTKIREHYNQLLKDKKVKKTKTGVRDTDGFLVLVPRA